MFCTTERYKKFLPSNDVDPAESANSAVRPWASLLIRDFSLIWISSVLAATCVQIRNVSNLYQVYHLSGSSFQLGLTGFFQALPHVVFGLFAGVLADAFDRKKVILATHFLHLVPSLSLGFLTMTGTIQVWHIYLFSLMSSLIEVFSWPARSAIVPGLVPPSYLMNAITLTSMILQSSFLVGPAVAGMLIDHIGLAFAYFISASLFVPKTSGRQATRESSQYDRGHRIHLGAADYPVLVLAGLWRHLGRILPPHPAHLRQRRLPDGGDGLRDSLRRTGDGLAFRFSFRAHGW
ncbi:MAG: MFS transporter [Deltaproteobacteria bacterium]|nr:MAG: MFS transporter [Deltaproteobacteria bacterium]